jgi:cell division transport system permease protein
MFLFAIKEAFKSIKRAKLYFTLSLISTSLGLLLIQVSVLSILASNELEKIVKNQFVVNVFLADSLSANNIENVRNVLLNNKFISNVKYISKEEAANNFINETGEDFRNVLEYNPLPASFSVTLIPELPGDLDVNKIIKDFEKIPNVESVAFQSSLFAKMLNYLGTFKKYIFGFTIILILIAVYLIYSTLKLILYSRIEEIETMKLVGAKLLIIKLPIILNGSFIGFFSSIISTVLLCVILYFTSNYISFFIKLTPLYLIFFGIMLTGLLIGTILSVIILGKVSLKN